MAEAKIGKWASSLAVRLPAHVCRDADIGAGDVVDIECTKERGGGVVVVMRPVRRGGGLEDRLERADWRGRPLPRDLDRTWLDGGGGEDRR